MSAAFEHSMPFSPRSPTRRSSLEMAVHVRESEMLLARRLAQAQEGLRTLLPLTLALARMAAAEDASV
jgi:hypothetical protein